MHDRGLSSDVGSGRDGRGRALSREARYDAAKLRRLNRRVRLADGGRRESLALSRITAIASAMDLPRAITERAATMYRAAARRGLIRGRSIDAVAAASVLAACRERGLPRTLHEVADASGFERAVLARTYRAVARALGWRRTPGAIVDHVAPIASILGADPRTESAARATLARAVARGAGNGTSALGLVGAALYHAGREAGTGWRQRDVAKAAGVTEVTIRARLREIEASEAAAGAKLLVADAP